MLESYVTSCYDRARVILAFFGALSSACAPSKDTPADSTGGIGATAGSAAAGSGGLSSGTGGSAAGNAGRGGGAGAGGVDCARMWSDYQRYAGPARLCDPAETARQCDIGWVVHTPCGCSIPANGLSPDYREARERLAQYIEVCPYPSECSSCFATAAAACVSGDGGAFLCEYQ